MSPESLFARLPAAVAADLGALDALIVRALPGEPRSLWTGTFWGGSRQTIVGYGDVRYRNRSGRAVRWFKVGLAPQKHGISLYVNATDADGYLVKKYASRLGKVKVGSASISFRRAADVDRRVLRSLLRRASRQTSAGPPA